MLSIAVSFFFLNRQGRFFFLCFYCSKTEEGYIEWEYDDGNDFWGIIQ